MHSLGINQSWGKSWLICYTIKYYNYKSNFFRRVLWALTSKCERNSICPVFCYALCQGSASFFYMNPNTKCFRLCWSDCLTQLLDSVFIDWNQPLTICRHMKVAVFQQNLIYTKTWQTKFGQKSMFASPCLKCYVLILGPEKGKVLSKKMLFHAFNIHLSNP